MDYIGYHTTNGYNKKASQIAKTNADVVRYSMLNGSDQLFAAKYKLYLPSEEELRAEIETQNNTPEPVFHSRL